ncbi:MAG: cellulose biosynthesis cyclic di-GMP-binding regulatory protein BcsB, partial [Lachnospiraceae bacterium]
MKTWKMILAAMVLSTAMIGGEIPVSAAGTEQTTTESAAESTAKSDTESDGESTASSDTESEGGSGTISVKEGTEITNYVLSSDPSMAGAPVTEPPSVPDTQYTKTFHYSSDVTFSGIYKTNTFSFKKETYWDVQYAYAQIEFTVSPLIVDDVPASLTFSVNDTPISSCRVDYDLGASQTAYVSIPVSLLNDGYNNLSITGYVLLYDEEGCLDDFTNANWINISENSVVQMGYDVDDTGNLLKYYPFPLISSMDETGKDCGVYIPEDATSGELTAAMMLRSQLGAQTTDSDDISIADFSAMGERAQRLIVATADRLPEEVKNHMPESAGDGASYDLSLGALVYEYSDDTGTVLVVTADNESDLEEGAVMLMDDDLLAQENGSAAFIPSGTKDKAISNQALSDLIIDHETITGITNEKGLTFIGPFRQEQTIYLPLSGGFVLAEGGKISLNFRYSDNLDFDRSLLTVYWGDTPIASKKLTKENAGGDTFSFTIPSDVVGTYASSIRIAFDLEIKDLYCTKRTDEMPWAYVSGDSTLYLPVGQSTDYSLTL